MRRVLRKISSGEGDQLGDMSTLAGRFLPSRSIAKLTPIIDPSIVDAIKTAVAAK